MPRSARSPRLLLCTAIAACVLAVPASAGAATLTGTLTLVHADGATTPTVPFWTVATPQVTRVAFPGSINPKRAQGRRVRLRGTLRNGRLAVTRGGLTVLGAPRPKARTAAAHQTIVVLIALNGTGDYAGTPADPTAATNAIFGTGGTSVRDYYRTQTYGQVDLTGSVVGPYTVNDPQPGGCQFNQWSNDASNQAIADGHPVYDFQTVVYLFVDGDCGFAGLGVQPGSFTWINNFNTYTIEHEIGHTFGAAHASSLRCHDGATVVTLSATCDPYSEYGDPFDPMGSGGSYPQGSSQAIAREMEPFRKVIIGAIPQSDTPLVRDPGTYRISPLELSSGTRMLRLDSGRTNGDGKAEAFDLSVRRPIGAFDSFYTQGLDPQQTPHPEAVNGVLVNLDTVAFGGDNTMVLDMSPNTPGGDIDPYFHTPTSGFDDAPLQVGATFTDPHTGLTLRTDSVDDTGAQVTVSYGPGEVDVANPTAPGQPVASVSGTNVALTWPAATDGFGVTGYTVTRDGTDITTTGATSAADAPGVGTHTYTVRARDAAGHVGRPSPAATVTIRGDSGPKRLLVVPRRGCLVPALAGATLASAKRTIVRFGCKLGRVTKAKSATVKSGRIVASTPKANTDHRLNTKIAVVVSRGKR